MHEIICNMLLYQICCVKYFQHFAQINLVKYKLQNKYTDNEIEIIEGFSNICNNNKQKVKKLGE